MLNAKQIVGQQFNECMLYVIDVIKPCCSTCLLLLVPCQSGAKIPYGKIGSDWWDVPLNSSYWFTNTAASALIRFRCLLAFGVRNTCVVK